MNFEIRPRRYSRVTEVQNLIVENDESERLQLTKLWNIFNQLLPEFRQVGMAGFPTLKLAMRYVLTDSAYCLVPRNANYDLALRASANDPLPDLRDEDLQATTTIREVLLACKPHLDIQHPKTILQEIDFFIDHDDVAGTFAELVELICGTHTDQSAEAVRISLGFLRNAGFLQGNPDDDPSVRKLTLSSEASTFESGLVILRTAIARPWRSTTGQCQVRSSRTCSSSTWVNSSKGFTLHVLNRQLVSDGTDSGASESHHTSKPTA